MLDNGSVPTRTWILLTGSLRVPVSQAAVGDGSLTNYCKKTKQFKTSCKDDCG